MTFLPNSKLSVGEDELSYILRTKEGPTAKLNLDTGKTSLDLQIGDIGPEGKFHGRALIIRVKKTEDGKITSRFEAGNFKESMHHGFVRFIGELEGKKGTLDTTAEMGELF